MRDSAGGIRSHYEAFERWHGEQSAESMAVRRLEADLSFAASASLFGGRRRRRHRTTDPVRPDPRVIPADEWRRLDAGLKQRVRALNMFIHDIYHGHDIVRAGWCRPSRSS